MEAVYFDFSLSSYLYSESEELEAAFYYYFDGYDKKDFRVKPVAKDSEVEIYNTKLQKWVSSADIWSHMPNIEDHQKLRVRKVTASSSSEISFLIQNVRTGEIYTTSKKRIFSPSIYNGYISRINSRLVDNRIWSENNSFLLEHSEPGSGTKLISIPSFITIIVVCVTSLMLFLVAFYVSRRDKIIK